ncbi:NUDIX domain-containing protein [Formosa maritima]|uniref:NUDIX domain-containing protein n=2 Tax=Formosa maritima TaxID=2592046 RepID=A0A5D0GDI5_9FLAO|nr:NUDIX domain-containing protein [Formosa maritima]
MDELIDIITKDQKPTGKTALKSEIHTKGYYHNTAHVWYYTKKGEILLAQRAATKTICPLLWDVSVAGHVDAGETIEEAAIRETQEEIGLAIRENELYKIGVFPCFQTYENGIVDNEFHHTFLVELNVSINKLTPQIGEVETLKLVSISEFKKILKFTDNNNHLVPSNKTYYQVVLKHILQLI